MQTNYNFTPWQFRPVRFGAEDMREVGLASLLSMRGRISRGVTANDTPARPLSAAYARKKASLGLGAIRDWRYTGETMARLDVVEVVDGAATIGLPTVAGQKLGSLSAYNSRVEQIVGLSPSDQQSAGAKLAEIFAAKVRGER